MFPLVIKGVNDHDNLGSDSYQIEIDFLLIRNIFKKKCEIK